MISERQIKIIIILHNVEGYITYKKIAEKLKVSVTTVRNDIAAIKEYIIRQKTGSLITMPHSGIRLIVNELEWEKLYSEMYLRPVKVRDNIDILYAVIDILLKRKSIRVSDIKNNLYVSRALVDKTVNLARQWFDENNIFLEKKRGKGLEIHYLEFNWRLAMWNFFKKFKDLIKQEKTKSIVNIHSISNVEYNAIIEVLQGFNISGVVEAIHYIEEKNGFRYSYDASIRMIFLLSLCIVQTRKKIMIEVPQPISCKTDGIYDELILKDLINYLNECYNIQFPSCEREYIKFVLAISNIQEFTNEQAKQTCKACSSELYQFTIKVINLTSEIYNIDLSRDTFLIEHLFLELKSMIERLKYHVNFKNPLLKQIKQKYPNLIATAWGTSTVFDKELGLDINENEVGFLALHLGGAIDRCRSLIKACVVCNYGIGISQILKEKIEKEINGIKIVEILSNRDRRKIRALDCDFVISTIPIEEIGCRKDVMVVNNLLLSTDIRNIKNKMKQIRKEKLRTENKRGDMDLQWRLFSEEAFYTDLNIDDKDKLLKFLCKKLENMGCVTKEFEASVMERESKTSTEVGKMIGVPHGNSDYVIHSIVSVAVLNKPIKWFDGNEVDLVFLLAFDLDNRMRSQIVKFYKTFVSFLDNDEVIKGFKKNKNKKELVNYLNNM